MYQTRPPCPARGRLARRPRMATRHSAVQTASAREEPILSVIAPVFTGTIHDLPTARAFLRAGGIAASGARLADDLAAQLVLHLALTAPARATPPPARRPACRAGPGNRRPAADPCPQLRHRRAPPDAPAPPQPPRRRAARRPRRAARSPRAADPLKRPGAPGSRGDPPFSHAHHAADPPTSQPVTSSAARRSAYPQLQQRRPRQDMGHPRRSGRQWREQPVQAREAVRRDDWHAPPSEVQQRREERRIRRASTEAAAQPTPAEDERIAPPIRDDEHRPASFGSATQQNRVLGIRHGVPPNRSHVLFRRVV